MMLHTVLHLLLCLCYSTTVSSAQETLAVAVITRHGRRNPNSAYPGDPFEEEFKKGGYGILNPDGKFQMYKVGKNLGHAFPELKRRNFTLLRSSESDRTRETVRLIMQGLEGPSERINDFDWPIEYTVKKDDALLNHADVDCPKRRKSIDESTDLKFVHHSFASIWASIAKILHVTPHLDYDHLFYALENLYTEYVIELDMPRWATRKLYERIRRQLELMFWFTGRLEIEGKLSGVFYRELIDRFREAEASRNVSLFVYGTHDTTLCPIMINLDLWQNRRPATGESLIFVLKTDGQLEVHFYENDHIMYTKTLPGCSRRNCTLDKFEKAVQHLIPQDWRAECSVG